MAIESERILGLQGDPHAACDAALSLEAEDNQRLTRDLTAATRTLADQQARDALILRLLEYVRPDDDERALRAAIIHVQQLLAGTRRQQAHTRALARLADEYPNRLTQLAAEELADPQEDGTA